MNKIKMFLVLVVAVFSIPAFANKTSVELTVPENAIINSTVKLIVKVKHNGNNSFHYTNWVIINANGKEIARWDYNKKNLPEKSDFVKEVDYKVTAPVEIEAQGNCSLHGSAGKKAAKISIK
jgi:desulfoferrodoxin (superoxide reductase-like protein)